MSKKLNLANAISIFKKGKESRDIKLTEKEIAKFIDGQIKLKTEEIEEAKTTRKETSDENYDDFKDLLLNLDDSNISSRSARQNTAETYVGMVLRKVVDNQRYEDRVAEQVKGLEEETGLLKQLRFELEEIKVEVEQE